MQETTGATEISTDLDSRLSSAIVKPVPNVGRLGDHAATLPTSPEASVPPLSPGDDLEAAHPCAQGDEAQEGPANGLASTSSRKGMSDSIFGVWR